MIDCFYGGEKATYTHVCGVVLIHGHYSQHRAAAIPT